MLFVPVATHPAMYLSSVWLALPVSCVRLTTLVLVLVGSEGCLRVIHTATSTAPQLIPVPSRTLLPSSELEAQEQFLQLGTARSSRLGLVVHVPLALEQKLEVRLSPLRRRVVVHDRAMLGGTQRQAFEGM